MLAILIVVCPMISCGDAVESPEPAASAGPAQTEVVDGSKKEETTPQENKAIPLPKPKQPDHIEVVAILVSFRSTPMGVLADRDQEAARLRAEVVNKKFQAGDDGMKLATEFSDDPNKDRHKGIFKFRNHGVGLSTSDEELARSFLPVISNAGFALEVGESTVVAFDKATSPLGYYVVKRTK